MFFSVVLTKKYTNPSSDIIDVLAGLDNVDAVLSDLVATLDTAIKNGRDGKINLNEKRGLTDDLSVHKAKGHQSRYSCCGRWLPNSIGVVLCTP